MWGQDRTSCQPAIQVLAFGDSGIPSSERGHPMLGA